VAELWIADQWIFQTLKNDTTLANLVGGTASPRIYADIAPADAAAPYIVFQNQSAVDSQGIGAIRIMVDALYVVRGIAPTDTFGGALAQIADRVDTLLHDVAGTAGGGNIVASVREAPFRLTEPRDGKVWRHLGGIYRIYAQE
jgi:hypothetical protein